MLEDLFDNTLYSVLNIPKMLLRFLWSRYYSSCLPQWFRFIIFMLDIRILVCKKSQSQHVYWCCCLWRCFRHWFLCHGFVLLFLDRADNAICAYSNTSFWMETNSRILVWGFISDFVSQQYFSNCRFRSDVSMFKQSIQIYLSLCACVSLLRVKCK